MTLQGFPMTLHCTVIRSKFRNGIKSNNTKYCITVHKTTSKYITDYENKQEIKNTRRI